MPKHDYFECSLQGESLCTDQKENSQIRSSHGHKYVVNTLKNLFRPNPVRANRKYEPEKTTESWKQKLEPQEMHLFSAQGHSAQMACCKLICHA